MAAPGEEVDAVRTRVLDAAEALGEVRAVLESLEASLGERVVVGDVRSRVRLGDAEVGEKLRDELGAHRAAAIGVQGELLTLDAMANTGLGDQRLRERRALALGDHPTNDAPAEHVHDHVQVVVRPGRRPLELGDVPRPELIRLLGEQLGRGIAGVAARARRSRTSSFAARIQYIVRSEQR